MASPENTEVNVNLDWRSEGAREAVAFTCRKLSAELGIPIPPTEKTDLRKLNKRLEKLQHLTKITKKRVHAPSNNDKKGEYRHLPLS